MVLDTIKKIIAEQMSIDENLITENSSFNDFKADSIDIVEIVMKIEDELGVAFDKAEDIKNVKELLDYINEQQS